MLPKINRLTKEEDFRKVFRSGNRRSCYLFDLFVFSREKDDHSRFGFVVSNRVSKKAVFRNRSKRLLRESVFELPESFFFGRDYILSAKHALINAAPGSIRDEVRKIFQAIQ